MIFLYYQKIHKGDPMIFCITKKNHKVIWKNHKGPSSLMSFWWYKNITRATLWFFFVIHKKLWKNFEKFFFEVVTFVEILLWHLSGLWCWSGFGCDICWDFVVTSVGAVTCVMFDGATSPLTPSGRKGERSSKPWTKDPNLLCCIVPLLMMKINVFLVMVVVDDED